MAKANVSINIIMSIFECCFELFLNLPLEQSALYLERSAQMESVGAATQLNVAPTDFDRFHVR